MKFNTSAIVFLTCLANFAPLAHAESFKSKSEGWLVPGWSGAMEATKSGGMTYTFYMEDEGMIICGSTTNPSNEVIPSAGHCNSRIGSVGYHVPPEFLFQGEAIWKVYGKILLVSLPLGMSQVSLPAATTSASVMNNLMSFGSPQAIVQAEHQLKNSFDTLARYGKDSEEKDSGVLARALMDYDFTTLGNALSDRVNKFVKHCNSIDNGKVDYDKNPKKKKPADFDYCHAQKANGAKSGEIMKECNIPVVTAQAGEPGQPELWRLGRPLPAGCMTTLQQNTAPYINKKTGEKSTQGQRLLDWARGKQVAEWIAENASTSAEKQSLTAEAKAYAQNNSGKTAYDWLLIKDPTQADPKPAAAAAGQ